MTSVRRLSRRRVDACPIIAAWDAGSPPPDAAHDPARRGEVIACLFFRWAERRPAWVGPHHPHIREWLAAMDSHPA